MADKSAIEWTDATWNPIRARNIATGKVGWHCEHATTGCEFCYAEGFNKRLGTGLPFKPGHRKDIELFLDEGMLTQPLRWKKLRMIFPGSMTDLFADFVTDEMLDKIFAVMALSPQHTFQVLTKRAARMRAYMTARSWYRIHQECFRQTTGNYPGFAWPLPNVWLGVSTERQQEADERIPLLLQTPAAVRFISAEPLLGPIDLRSTLGGIQWIGGQRGHGGRHRGDGSPGCPREPHHHHDERCERGLDWVIVGGESGPKARPMHPQWAGALRDQCQAAGVPFFFKQWGEWAPSTPEEAEANPRSGWRTLKAHPHVARAEELYPEAGAAFIARVGKKAAGRLLDGVEHNGFPEARS